MSERVFSAFELYIFMNRDKRVCVRVAHEDRVLGPVVLSGTEAGQLLAAVGAAFAQAEALQNAAQKGSTVSGPDYSAMSHEQLAAYCDSLRRVILDALPESWAFLGDVSQAREWQDEARALANAHNRKVPP